MCEFCDYYHSTKGNTAGKEIKIHKCANETDLTDCQVICSDNDRPALIIFSYGAAKGYINIEFCPLCGRKLNKVSGNDNITRSTDELIEKFRERLSPEDFEKFKTAAYEFGKSLGVMFEMIGNVVES